MTDKNIKKTQKAPIPKEDIQLYRLFAIFGAAILGFAGLRLIGNYEGRIFGFLAFGQWIAAALLVAVIAGLVYIRFVKKLDESTRVFTSVGIAYFLIPLLLMLVTYRHIHDANVKFQVAFALVSLFAIVFNVFKREFRNISALVFADALFLYYASAKTYNGFETALAYVSKVLVFLVPVAVIVLLAIAMRAKGGKVVVGGKNIYTLPERFSGVLALVMAAILLVAGALLVIFPAAFTYVMIALLVLYVIVGIVCTIRLI